jgi:hypothetical protein
VRGTVGELATLSAVLRLSGRAEIKMMPHLVSFICTINKNAKECFARSATIDMNFAVKTGLLLTEGRCTQIMIY